MKEAKFDETAQTMKIYVAGTTNLVKTISDAEGNIANRLPIGTVTVEKMSDKYDNAFKIVLNGNTGNLKTVGLDGVVKDAAETYGEDFEIPVDGTVFAVPDHSFTVVTSGSGTVKAYKVNSDGTETLLTDNNTVKDSTIIHLDVKANDGYKLTSVTLKDKESGEVKALGDDYSFAVSADSEVSVVFEEISTDDSSENCDCLCHKGGFLGLIYKLVRIIWRHFRVRRICDCGVAHYV